MGNSIVLTPKQRRAIGKRVEALRYQYAMKYNELAEKIGIHVRVLARMRNGKDDVSARTLVLLGRAEEEAKREREIEAASGMKRVPRV